MVAESVAKWAVEEFPEGANYFVLEGPAGVGVVNERNKGWDNVVGAVPSLKKVGAQTANWSTEEAKSVFETVLKANKNDIQLVFAQNDEMGLGAVQAAKEAGLAPGEDVKIATIDGTKPALEALAAGELSFVAEYNPLFGDTALTAVKAALDGRDGRAVHRRSRARSSPHLKRRRRPCPTASTDQSTGIPVRGVITCASHRVPSVR